MGLADEAGVDEALDLEAIDQGGLVAREAHLLAREPQRSLEEPRERREIEIAGPDPARLAVLEGEIGGLHPDRRRDARLGRGHDMIDAEARSQADGVHRPGAAEADQHVVARIDALLHRDDVDRGSHVRVRDLVDRPGGAHDARAERLGDLASDRRVGPRGIERQRAAGESLGGQVSEYEIRVRHGR